jgi:hypothetical protein
MSWHVVTLLVIVVSLGTQLVLVVRGIDVLVPEEGQATPGVLTRVLRFFSYFTVQSNVLVALSVLPLVAGAVFLVADSRLPRKPEIMADTNVGIQDRY